MGTRLAAISPIPAAEIGATVAANSRSKCFAVDGLIDGATSSAISCAVDGLIDAGTSSAFNCATEGLIDGATSSAISCAGGWTYRWSY